MIRSTQRVKEVLRRVAAGIANKEVAAQLAIAEETVKAHILGTQDRTYAVIRVKRGMIGA
jgi:DNA-binding CsgD family transcriptional regulator